jgi:hypothetical protein
MSNELSDFFKLIAQERRQKNEEIEKDKKILKEFENFIYPDNKVKKKLKDKKIKLPDPPDDFGNLSNISPPPLKEETLIEKSLGLLSEPSNIKQKEDPITPINQNFATHEDLQKHYKLFLERIQQQLSTLGGGGETNLAFMDVPVTSVTTSFYTITPRDYYIGVNYSGAVSIRLPKADRQGKIFVVKDELGEASKGTNRYITILPSGDDLIDGRDRAILAYDYGSLTFIWKGNSWRVI